MATLTYDLVLSDNKITRLEVREASNDWEAVKQGPIKLCVSDGTVDDRDGELKLLGVENGTPRTVLILKETGWDGNEGDRGKADCKCCGSGCEKAPNWTLRGVE